MHRRERTVSFYDLKAVTSIRASQLVPVQISAREALELVFAVVGNTKPVFHDGEVHVTLEDWEFNADRKEYYVLFNRADPTGSDVPLKNLKTGQARMAGKTVDDGIDLSSHIVIRLPKSGAGPALLIMTGGSGLSAAKLAVSLSRMLRLAEKVALLSPQFKRADPSGASGAQIKVKHSFELLGHQSKYLKEILQSGHLEGMELISDTAQKLDSDGSFMITSTILRVEPFQTGKMTLSKLISAIKGAPNDIDRARIKFKEAGESAFQTHTFALNELEAAFVLKERIISAAWCAR